MNNINNYDELIAKIKEKKFPKVLMHACCGPCSSACLDVMMKGLNVDLYFSNSNIDTNDEFTLRENELIKLNEAINKTGKVIIDQYEPNDFYQAIKGLEHLGERSERCYQCYLMRMEKTCRFAKENGYDYFTTSLSLSPHKNATWINEIGVELSKKYQMPFIYSNFKLKNGFQKSIEYSKQYNLYRQNYCGCHYSKIERGVIDE